MNSYGKEITNEGNLPKVLQVLAKEIKGHGRATRFYECKKASEIEEAIKNNDGEELSCVLDPKTKRGFLVGFGFADTNIVMGKDSFVQMKVFFVELCTEDFNRYSVMLQKHRRQQEDDMIKRRRRI